MNTQYFSPNPYDNLHYLAEQFLRLTPEQQVAAFLAVSEKYHRERCGREELAGTVQRVNRQYERALLRITTLQRELQQFQAPDLDEAA